MGTQRFRALVAAGPRGRAVIAVPLREGGGRSSSWRRRVRGAREIWPDDRGRFGELAANPAAAAFFDTLAQFYRKAYLRWIDATTRRPELRAARIAEVVDLLAAGIKQRPRS